MFWWQPGDSWQLVKSLVSFDYGVGLAHCLAINYFGKPNPTLKSFCFWQCSDVSLWNRHDVKGYADRKQLLVFAFLARTGKGGMNCEEIWFCSFVVFQTSVLAVTGGGGWTRLLGFISGKSTRDGIQISCKIVQQQLQKIFGVQPTCTTTWPCLFWYIISNHNSLSPMSLWIH